MVTHDRGAGRIRLNLGPQLTGPPTLWHLGNLDGLEYLQWLPNPIRLYNSWQPRKFSDSPHPPEPGSSMKRDMRQIEAIAREFGMEPAERREFGDYLEDC